MQRRESRLWGTLLFLSAGVMLACGSETSDPAPVDPATLSPYADGRYAATEAERVSSLDDFVHTFRMTSNVPGIRDRRMVVILPPDYFDDASAERRYPVVYMQDGDNVLTTSAFGHGGWEIHIASRDLTGVTVEPVIFVAPYNAGEKRRAEYTQAFAEEGEDGATPDKYLDFLQYNVMPFIDGQYRTQIDANTRGIGGSSSGAILALYAAWTRPNVYRRVIAMSTFHWDIDTFLPLVDGTETKPPLHRVYLDSGTPDDGVEEMNQIATALQNKGFELDQDLKTYIGENQPHNESSWRQRFPIGFEFVYPQ